MCLGWYGGQRSMLAFTDCLAGWSALPELLLPISYLQGYSYRVILPCAQLFGISAQILNLGQKALLTKPFSKVYSLKILEQDPLCLLQFSTIQTFPSLLYKEQLLVKALTTCRLLSSTEPNLLAARVPSFISFTSRDVSPFTSALYFLTVLFFPKFAPGLRTLHFIQHSERTL